MTENDETGNGQQGSGRAPISITRILWLFLLVGTISLYVLRQAQDGVYGKDFTMFLTGGHMLAQGQGSNLYDLSVQAQVQELIKGPVTYPGGVLPFNYPPYIALLFLPLTILTPAMALYVWLAVQILVLLTIAISAAREAPGGGLPPIFFLAGFVPLIEALLMGQMSLVLLLLWWWAFLSWRSGNWVTLGIAVSLSAFKPQMVVLLIVALLVCRMWRSLAVAAGVQAALWGLAMLLFGPGILGSYLNILRVSGTTTDGTLGFNAGAMTNFRGLLATLGFSPEMGLQLAFAAWIVSIGLVAWIWWRSSWPLHVRFGVTALLAVIFSPHLYVHDATLLLVAPLCLYVSAKSEGDANRLSSLVLPYVALFVAMYSLVLGVVASYTSLIIATLLCSASMLYVLLRSIAVDTEMPERLELHAIKENSNV